MMSQRPQSLEVFLDRFCAFLEARPLEEAARELVSAARDLLESRIGECGRTPPHRLPLCDRWLEPALELATERSTARARLIEAFREVEPRLAWHQRAGSRSDPAFHRGHANAMIVGPGDLEERKDVWLGLTLMAPETSYIRHQHPPEELYLLLTPGEWQQGDGPWFSPGPDGLVYNRPMLFHAMRSGKAPLVTFWLLRT